MKANLKQVAVLAALCGCMAAAHVYAATPVASSHLFQTDGETSVAPPGPEADLYLQHYQGTPSVRYAEQYWNVHRLNGQDPAHVSLFPPGPEADLYLQHYQGTPSVRYAAPYWSEHALNGQDLEQVSVAPPGPEADLYLQHYHGTPSVRYGQPGVLTAKAVVANP